MEGFAVLSAAPLLWHHQDFVVKPKSRSELHIRIQPESGLVVEGDLFGYAALDTGQYFLGELICQNQVAWEKLKELADLAEEEPIPLKLGRAARQGYGHVTAWLKRLDSADPLAWIPQPIEQRVQSPNDIVLTLLTDTIVTDAWGRFPLGFTSAWLTEALGLQVEIIPGTVAARTRPIDSFNVYLGMPRWRDIALEAGSAVRLKVLSPPVDWLEKLRALEYQGIGLRRGEGFGQIAFNHPVYTQCRGITRSDVLLNPKMRLHSGEHDLDAESAFRNRWTQKLDEKNWTVFGQSKLAQSYMALARWLHAHQGTPPSDLRDKLNSLGEPDAALQNAINAYSEEFGRYGERSKENKIKGTPGLQLVNTLLGELGAENKQHWPTGIAMLAERVANAAEKGGK
ncbi:MAG: hypothetical protein FJ026_15210 [Chloroflexi bacterium]|nr:hypothetical protein [Chloroflexota bacterium]